MTVSAMLIQPRKAKETIFARKKTTFSLFRLSTVKDVSVEPLTKLFLAAVLFWAELHCTTIF